MAKRGRKMAQELRARIRAWEEITGGKIGNGAYRKPGAKRGDYDRRYGA